MNAGVLSPVFLRSNNGSRTIEPRRYPSPYPCRTPSLTASYRSSGDVHVLAEVDEDHGVPRVLTVGVLTLGGELLIADQQVEHPSSERRLLELAGSLDQPDHLFGDLVVDLDAQIPDDASDLRRIDLARFRHHHAMLTAVLPGVRVGERMPRWPRISRRWLAPPAFGSPGRRRRARCDRRGRGRDARVGRDRVHGGRRTRGGRLGPRDRRVEGKVVLFAAVASLLVMLAMRISAPEAHGGASRSP